MNKKIFNAIWIVAVVVFLASLIIIMNVSYNYFSGMQLKQLKTEAELASQGVTMSGLDYLNSLDPAFRICSANLFCYFDCFCIIISFSIKGR